MNSPLIRMKLKDLSPELKTLVEDLNNCDSPQPSEIDEVMKTLSEARELIQEALNGDLIGINLRKKTGYDNRGTKTDTIHFTPVWLNCNMQPKTNNGISLWSTAPPEFKQFYLTVRRSFHSTKTCSQENKKIDFEIIIEDDSVLQAIEAVRYVCKKILGIFFKADALIKNKSRN